jgi:hypothetical protein
MKSKIVIIIVISGINNGEIMASMAIISMAKYHQCINENNNGGSM